MLRLLALLESLSLALLLSLLVTHPAWADGAPTTAISLLPWIAIIQPYAQLIFGDILVPIAVAWGIALLSKWTGVTVSAANVERIKSAARTEAGAAIAEAADNLKGRSITVDSTIVRNAVTNIQDRIPGILKATGATPEIVGQFVAGEIGKLQAVTPSTTVVSGQNADTAVVNLGPAAGGKS